MVLIVSQLFCFITYNTETSDTYDLDDHFNQYKGYFYRGWHTLTDTLIAEIKFYFLSRKH